MALGVFIHRTDSVYDDSPAERYQFPKQYFGRVSACVGNWILYYEPRKVNDTRGYFAIARIQEIISDPSIENMYIAIVESGTYLDFANPVPFSDHSGILERGLLNDEGRISGRAQSAVREISPGDFNRIVSIGLSEDEPILPRGDDTPRSSGFEETQTPFEYETERNRMTYLSSRIVRDRIFRRVVLRAYDERCAIAGLKLINGRGRAEVAAAHIKSVAANGPDIVNNGIALCGTAHWMFDRGLLSLSDDLEILVSRQVNDLETVQAFINKTGRAHAPSRSSDRPHPAFLKWHRDNCFKQ
jgi:putative restriction endonuclease